MKCSNCGCELNELSRFCIACGKPVESAAPKAKPKKKKGCLIAFLVTIGLLGLMVLSLFIFLPGLFGPKDLGVETSKKMYKSAIEKLGYEKDEAPKGEDPTDYVYTYGEPKAVEVALDSEELTSFFNYNRPKYYAMKDVQIRVNKDDTVDFSGTLDTEYFLETILGGAYSREDITEAYPLLKFIPDKVNIYANFEGEIENNKAVDVAINDLDVMGIALPDSLYDSKEARTKLNDILDDFLETNYGKSMTYYESIRLEDGELLLNGAIPSSLKREEEGND